MYASAGNSSVDFPRQYRLYFFTLFSFSLIQLIHYINEPLKGTDCLQKSFDGIFILPDKV